MKTTIVPNNRLRKCLDHSSMVLGIAICSLFATTTADAVPVAQQLQVDFAFNAASVPNKQVTGYRLYVDGGVLCETQDPGTQSISCTVAAEDVTCDFTLSALFSDGSESPQSDSVQFTITDPDNDDDGIADSWEQTNFGNLTTANATSDYDHDGYSDLVEYQNDVIAAVDGTGASFNPTLANAPGGIGYSGNLPDSLVINYPGNGLYTYNSASSFIKINSAQSKLTIAADIDADGVDEIVSYFTGQGLYIWDNGAWGSRITTIEPEAMITFGNRLAIDFGPTYGLYTYSANENFIRINSADPGKMTVSDIDADGSMELAVHFPGYGIYLWDNGTWGGRLTSINPENMVGYDYGLAIDFGASYGLYTYNTTDGFTRISSLNPKVVAVADVNSDGETELAVHFPGYGIYIWNNVSWSTRITSIEPEQMIKLGNNLAIDFGTAFGLYIYNSMDQFTRINNQNPEFLVEADVDFDGSFELATYFPGQGIYIWDNKKWSNKISENAPSLITPGNIVK